MARIHPAGHVAIAGPQSSDPRAPGRGDLYIGEVIHQANITVDESGTEAAAATAVIMEGRSASAIRTEPPRIDLDRPFVYLIRDVETGAILFMGRLVNPLPGE